MLTTQHYQNLKQPGHKKLFLLRLFPLCITLRTFEPSIEKILESILFFKSQNNFLTKTNQLPTGVFKNFEITKHPSKPTIFLPLMNAIGDPPLLRRVLPQIQEGNECIHHLQLKNRNYYFHHRAFSTLCHNFHSTMRIFGWQRITTKLISTHLKQCYKNRTGPTGPTDELVNWPGNRFELHKGLDLH